MNKQGSFLIELLVYLSVSVFLFFVSYKAIIYSYQNYKTLVVSINDKINILKSLNTLKEDLELADSEIENWKIDKNSIFFKRSRLSVNWFIKDNKLYRAEYNSEKRKVKNLIAKNVSGINLSLDAKDKNIILARLSIVSGDKTYNENIFLINGVYEIY